MAVHSAVCGVVEPIVLVRNSAVKHTVSKGHVASEHDMWQGIEFLISVWSHLEVRKATNDVEGEHITIVGCDALFTTGLDGSIRYFIPEMFELYTGMNGAKLLEDGILMHDEDHWSTLGLGIGSDCSDLDGSKLMVGNPSNIDGAIGVRYDTTVIASNTAIGSSIDESTR